MLPALHPPTCCLLLHLPACLQTYYIRRKFRGAMEWLGQRMPLWSRQFRDFYNTPSGALIVWCSALLLLFTVPGLWGALNFVLLLAWCGAGGGAGGGEGLRGGGCVCV